MRSTAFAILLVGLTAGAPRVRADTVTDSATLELTGRQLPALTGQAIERLAVLACSTDACHPIPFQVDELTEGGSWVLNEGPHPSQDDPPQTFDDNDLLLFMAADAGDDLAPAQVPLPPSSSGYRVVVVDERDGRRRCVFILDADSPPRSDESYVSYQPADDLMQGRRIALGFSAGVPDRLIATSAAGAHGRATDHAADFGASSGLGVNLLDRFKVRARASLLWDLLHFTRDEGDLSTELIGWHRGPIRIIRYQQQRVRLGWGIRSPTFAVYTFFHRDFAELPVALWLNFKPTYFFTDIAVDVLLDFRNLDGWQLQAAGLSQPMTVGNNSAAAEETVLKSNGDWFALRGPQLTIAQTIDVSDSLAAARRHLMYRYNLDGRPPETVGGERPAVGYRFDGWEEVAAGALELKAVAFALPAEANVERFMSDRRKIRIGEIAAYR